MVKEHRYVFDLEDITKLIYTCPHCDMEVSYPIQGKFEPSTHCSSCSAPFMERSMNQRDPNITFFYNLRALLELSKLKPSKTHVRLSIVASDPNTSRDPKM